MMTIDWVVMMSPDDVVADHPACGGTEENVSGKVLLGEHTCQCRGGGAGINSNLDPGRGIFSSDYRGGGPYINGVAGYKRRVRSCRKLVKLPSIIIDSGTLAERTQLDDRVEDFGVYLSLAGEQSTFPEVIIVVEASHAIHGRRASDIAVHEVIRDVVGGVVETGVVANDIASDVTVL